MKHLLFPLLLLVAATQMRGQTTRSLPLSVEFQSILYRNYFGDYELTGENGTAIERQHTRDHRLGIFYQFSPSFEAGIQMTKNLFYDRQDFTDISLVGDSAQGHNGGVAPYRTTKEAMLVYNNYIGVTARQRLIGNERLSLHASVGVAAVKTYIKRSITNQYIDHSAFGTSGTRGSYQKWIPGVEGGLQIRYQATDWLAVHAQPSFLYGFGKAEELSENPFRYASASWGVSLTPKTISKSDPVKRNTIMAAIGFPLSISYERLLAQKGTTRHSARIFYDRYFPYEGMMGGAYNIKLGNGKHFFLAETGLNFSETYMNTIAMGYEYRGPKWLVLRVDGGAAFNHLQKLPRVQIHIGRAF